MVKKASDLKRWALLIGINDYASAPNLRGCANDVKLMSTTLQRLGFPGENVFQLTDAQATREAILSRLEDLMKRAASAAKSPSFLDSLVSAFKDLLDRDDPYATVVLYFSGWGVRVVPETGQDSSQIAANVIMPWTSRPSYRTKKVSMPESMMSALVPYDWREELPQSAITYEEIRAWLSRLLPITPNITVIFDAPFAGTLLSGIAREDGKQPVFMGACRTDELCYVTSVGGGTYQGVFTYILGQALLRAEPSTTYRDVFKDVSAQVPARWPYQHPQIEGDLARMVFGTSQAERKRVSGIMRFVTVAQREKDRATLGAGAANGVTVKSLWTIYPQETQQVTEQTPKLGVVEISLVTADRGEARILSEAAAEAIQPGAKAVEEAHYYGDMQLAVKMQEMPEFQHHATMLKKQILSSELLRLAEGDEPASVTVHVLTPRGEALETDLVPELGSIDEAMWAVVPLSSGPPLELMPIADPSSTYLLRDKLENLARYNNVLGLRNPNLNSPLAAKVEFLLQAILEL